MREIVRKRQFKKDFQAIALTGRNRDRLVEAVTLLQAGEALPAQRSPIDWQLEELSRMPPGR
jgi:mRNA-degrading endonuclease YafQ of YafQ-DinJ toxin-antitoxin module